MANLVEIKIPNLGEAQETEIIEISVKPGDVISKNDPIVVLESEKAAMEVPSDFSGKIKEIKVKEGDSVSEGKIFAVIEVDEELEEKEKNLKQDVIELDETEKDINTDKNTDVAPVLNFSGINAGPAVRKIARELVIDLSEIIGTGKNKMVTKDDLKNYIHSLKDHKKTSYADISKLEDFGSYKLINQPKIKKLGANNLYDAWSSIPHVTHFDEADFTLLETQRTELNRISAQKITPLAFIAKAVSMALEEYPIFNSALVGEGKLMLRNYINLGIAVNTDDGLIVPVIKDVNALNIGQIASKITELTVKARTKKLLTKDMSGATFTISSLGSIGGTGFTPIINPPEVGIMGVSKTKSQASFNGGEIVEKFMLPFSVSYDHRVINGVDAGNFVSFVRKTLEKGLI